MTPDNEELSCDVCGRLVRGGLENDRLSYCSDCQRFVCSICWVPGRDICRVCLHPGRVVAPRLRPRITETFVPSTTFRVQPDRHESVSSPGRAAHRSASVATRPAPPVRARRHRWAWPAVVGGGLVAIVAVAAALAASFGLGGAIGLEGSDGVTPSASASREAVLSGGASSAPSTVPPDPAATPGSYTVQSGDTLRGIARAVYGDELQWIRIYDSNRAVIPDADRLSVGQVLAIPRP